VIFAGDVRTALHTEGRELRLGNARAALTRLLSGALLDDFRMYKRRLTRGELDAVRRENLRKGRAFGLRHTAHGRVSDDYPLDGNGDDARAGSYVGVLTTAWVDRSFIHFALPALLDDEEVESATLWVQISGIDGTPADMDVYHLRDDNNNTIDVTDFQATATRVKSSLFTSGSPLNTFQTADVTDVVKADYANDPAGSRFAVFRFQLADESGPGSTSRYLQRITDTDPFVVYNPVLEINTRDRRGTLIMFR
jgi:hypothetical protein